MPRGKQSVKKGVWHIGGKKRKKQKKNSGAIPFGLIASVTGPILGEVAKPIFKKMIGGKIKRRRRPIKWYLKQ